MSYKLDATVIARLINIYQEAMITGMDVSVLFSEMELEPSNDDERRLVLTATYEKQIAREHARLRAKAEQLLADGLNFDELPS